MDAEKNFEFTAAIRGYHHYKRVWKPKENENLQCKYKMDNPFDVFSIKTVNLDDVIVGHLPRKISRITKLLLQRGAVVNAQLTSTHYRRSLILQGALEIACKVTVKLPATVKNHMLLSPYMSLVDSRYCEPKEEIIMGSFITKATGPLTAVPPSTSSERSKPAKKKPKRDMDNRSMCKRIEKKTMAQGLEKQVVEISNSESEQ